MLLCFGLDEDMQSSIVNDFVESNGRVMSDGAFEVYGVLAKTITNCADEATRRLEGAICDIEEVLILFLVLCFLIQTTSIPSRTRKIC
jgi:hypothetical protein